MTENLKTETVAAEVIPTKVAPPVVDSPNLRHGKQFYLANYDWDERTGTGDFTYADRATGEASQVQRPQRKYFIGRGN